MHLREIKITQLLLFSTSLLADTIAAGGIRCERLPVEEEREPMEPSFISNSRWKTPWRTGNSIFSRVDFFLTHEIKNGGENYAFFFFAQGCLRENK